MQLLDQGLIFGIHGVQKAKNTPLGNTIKPLALFRKKCQLTLFQSVHLFTMQNKNGYVHRVGDVTFNSDVDWGEVPEFEEEKAKSTL